MPQNLESDFARAVRKQKQRQRQRLTQQIGLLVLTTGLAAGAILIATQYSVLQAGSLTISATVAASGLVGLAVIMGFIFYWLQRQPASPRPPKTSGSRLHQPRFLQPLNFKYVLGFSLLVLALIYQANSSLVVDTPNQFIARLKYNPTPPTANSPWFWADRSALHPVVTQIPPDQEKSIQSVAAYIAQRETDPYLQVKALHDYVISRVTYDLDVLKTGDRPPQDARTVFATRKAVCEGYANLFLALGQAINLEVVYVSGKVRQDLAPLELIPAAARLLKSNYDWTLHAWNAVKVAGNWQLVDTTWDDSDSQSAEAYSAAYLMPPPPVMIISHLPKQPEWQLLHHPANLGSFEKQPILTPEFFMEQLTMAAPTEYQTTVQDTGLIEINHPLNYQKQIRAIFAKRQESEFSLWDLPEGNPFTQETPIDIGKCQSQRHTDRTTQISCKFAVPGDYQVLLYSRDQSAPSKQSVTHPIGQLRFRAS